jgi:hypothetical protein
MNKITFILISLLNFSIYAQPVLNASDINPLNFSNNVFFSNSSTVTVGSSGANVTWDFSTLQLTADGSSSSTSVLTAPFSSSFPTSNFFVNSIFSGSSSSSDFGYYNLTGSKLEAIGGSSDTAITVSYVNPETIFVFPFTYNTVVNDTYQTNLSASVLNKSVTYDAYGTVITAFGTYNNVMRFKQINDGNVSYTWFKLNPYQEIINASIDINGSIYFTVDQPTNNLAINQNPIKTQFSISPNPASENFTIKNEDFAVKEMFLNVYDILGNQIIKDNKIDSNSKNINISDFANGLYFIIITDNNNAILYSNKIIKN